MTRQGWLPNHVLPGLVCDLAKVFFCGTRAVLCALNCTLVRPSSALTT